MITRVGKLGLEAFKKYDPCKLTVVTPGRTTGGETGSVGYEGQVGSTGTVGGTTTLVSTSSLKF